MERQLPGPVLHSRFPRGVETQLYLLWKYGLDQSFRIMASQAIVLQVELIDDDVGDKLVQILPINLYRYFVLASILFKNVGGKGAIIDDYPVNTPTKVVLNGLHKI